MLGRYNGLPETRTRANACFALSGAPCVNADLLPKMQPPAWVLQLERCAMLVRRVDHTGVSGAVQRRMQIKGTDKGDRQMHTTDTQTYTQTLRHTHTQTDRHTHTQTDRHTHTQTDTHTHTHSDTHTQTHRDTLRHTDTQTHTHRHTDTQTHRHTETHTHT